MGDWKTIVLMYSSCCCTWSSKQKAGCAWVDKLDGIAAEKSFVGNSKDLKEGVGKVKEKE